MRCNRHACLLLLACAAPLCAAGAAPPRYRIETMAGSASLGDGGEATAAQFGAIKGIAVDARGNLYISDTDHHRVRKVTPAGVVSTVAGTGTAGFGGDGGPASAALLNLPYGLAVDAAGYLYIADLGNNRVRRVAPDGAISTYAGGGAGSGDGGRAVDARLMSPRNLALDAAGSLYISEFTGHRVRRVAPDGTIGTAAGTGIAGFNHDGPAATTQLNAPAGLAFDPQGGLLIADTANGRIRRLEDGQIATADGPWQSYQPVGLAEDFTGTLYIAGANSVLLSTSAATGDKWAAGTGVRGFSGDGGLALQAQLSAVWDVAADPAGIVYIADGARVRRIDRRSVIQTVAGDGYLQSLGDGRPAVSALLAQPMGVTLDGSGNLYIADAGSNRVRQVLPDGTIRTFAGNGEAGPGADWAPAGNSTLSSPMSVAMAASGSLLIADTYNHRVRAVDPGGFISTAAGTGVSGRGAEALPALQMRLNAPRGICADRSGNFFVADTYNHRVLRVPPGGLTQTAAGNGSAGDQGDGGPAPLAQLTQPGACALDTAGNLFIADTGNHRIRKVAPSGRITTVAGTGVAGAGGDEGPAAAAQLDSPGGVAVTDDGNIFIADTHNHRIRLVTPDGVIHTIAGLGSSGFSGDGGFADAAQLNAPAGVVLDGAGDLYFADSGNNRVRRLVPQQPAIEPPPVTTPPLSAVHAASLREGPAAPGEILVVFGAGIGPDEGVAGAFDASGLLPTVLGGAEARFDGIPAPLLYAQSGQLNVQVPYTVTGPVTHIEVFYQSKSAGTLDLAVAPDNPALFPVAVNQDGTLNSESNPAPRGTIVAFFATGEGLTDGANTTGLAAQPPYARPRQPVALTIGDIPAELFYAGAAPEQAGELQVNARIPGGFLPSGAAAVVLTVGTCSSPPLTIWVK